MNDSITLPKYSVLYHITIDDQSIVFNGENLFMVRVPQYIPLLLKTYSGQSLESACNDINVTYGEEKGIILIRGLQQLEKEGFFHVTNDQTIYEFDEKLSKTIEQELLLASAQLEVSSDCNLFCKYCYAERGTFHHMPKGFMTPDVARQFIQFYGPIARKETWINILGGEPLLNPHLKQIIRIIKEAETSLQKQFYIQVTTNGTLLDKEWAIFLSENNVKVCISIDGTKQIHDQLRPGPRGKGSYESVLNGLKNIALYGKDRLAVRVTCGKTNFDNIQLLYEQLFSEVGDVQLDISPVIVEPNNEMALTDSQLMAYPDMIRSIQQKRYQYHENQDKEWLDRFNASDILNRNMKVFHCSAGLNQIVVTIHGDIYPCVPFIKVKEMKMGSIYDERMILPEPFKNMLLKRGVIHRPQCKKCWAKYLCSGGCIGVNYLYAGHAHHPNENLCKLYRATEAGKLLCFADSWLQLKS